MWSSGLTKRAEPPPTRDVNPVKGRGPTGLCARDNGTASANGVGSPGSLGGQTPPIPIVLGVRVECEASGVVDHQYKPAPRNLCTMDIAQLEDSAFRPGRIQFVPDELSLFCSLCRVRALLHVRYPFVLLGC